MSGKNDSSGRPLVPEIERLKAVVSARIEEAERERDEARAERDILAARDAEFVKLAGIYLSASDAERWPQMADMLRALLDADPAVSLALHDAEVKAQALEEAAHVYPDTSGHRWLVARAFAVRKQAQ